MPSRQASVAPGPVDSINHVYSFRLWLPHSVADGQKATLGSKGLGLAFRERLAWKPGILGVGQGVREAIPFRAPQAERKPNPKFVMP